MQLFLATTRKEGRPPLVWDYYSVGKEGGEHSCRGVVWVHVSPSSLDVDLQVKYVNAVESRIY
jgi:hypothetical protein